MHTPPARPAATAPPPDVLDDAPYAEAWEEYARLGRTFFSIFILGFFAAPAAAWGLTALGGEGIAGAVFALIGLVWFPTSMVLGARWLFWPCPRCGRPYFFRGLYRQLGATRCRHCDLPVNAVNDDGLRLYKWRMEKRRAERARGG